MVKDLHEELKAWGRPGGQGNSLIVKTDGERAVVAFREALAKEHGGLITPEQPPKGEHVANGRVEEAGKTIRDMVRVLKLQFESNLGGSVQMSEPIMKWMVRWAAMMLSRFRVSGDSQTAYERQTGRRCQLDVVPFGERVWYRRLSSPDGKKAAMSSKWEEGIWLGHSRCSNEAWIGTGSEAVRAWSVRRRVTAERWDRHAISKLRATPEDPQVTRDDSQSRSPEASGPDEEPETEEEDEVTRRRYLRLRAKDFGKYGYSDECAGCTRMRRGAKPPYRHNQECRRRLDKSIKKDDKARWERYELRKPEGVPACSPPSECSEGESGDDIAVALEDEHGFPMISPLIRRLMAVDVTEMFSPPRVTVQAAKFGLQEGEA